MNRMIPMILRGAARHGRGALTRARPAIRRRASTNNAVVAATRPSSSAWRTRLRSFTTGPAWARGGSRSYATKSSGTGKGDTYKIANHQIKKEGAEGPPTKVKIGWGVAAALGGALLFTGGSFIQTVPAGHVGVYDLFGKVQDEPRHPGLHFKFPLASIRPMSVKTRRVDYSGEVPSKEGLNVQLDLSCQYRLDPTHVVDVYKTIGLKYADVIIKPILQQAVRAETAARDAKALYTDGREQIRIDLLNSLNKQLNPRGIVVEDVPLRSIVLPRKLREAIERKMQMEQESQRMEFILMKERQEAERKAIEAKGIADFQEIVTKGIDERLLKWKGIEATLKLAESPNSKVVVVGGGDGGLPLILGSGK